MADQCGSGWDAAFGQHRNNWRKQSGGWEAAFAGAPPWVSQLVQGWARGGPGPQGARGFGGGGPKVRRGDVRDAILDVIYNSDEPINGYQVIQQIAERTSGEWKPSPGSVYPTLAQLEDEGLVETVPTGRKAMQLTPEGRAYVEEHAAEMAALWQPFDRRAASAQADGTTQIIGQTVSAIIQVASIGTAEQRTRAIAILDDTRRRLYAVLADEPEDPDTDAYEVMSANDAHHDDESGRGSVGSSGDR